MNSGERRSNRRFNVNAPLTVLNGEEHLAAYTRDVSNKGIYFYLNAIDADLIHGDFEFVISFPPEITLSGYWSSRRLGRVVRREISPDGLVGIAAQILE
jgi:hypothetical protein